MIYFSNCIGLLLKRTPEIIYLQKYSVNSSIRVNFDSVIDPPSQESSKYFLFNFNYNVLLGTKYAVLQFESSLFFFFLHFADNVGVYTGGRAGGVVLVSCDLMWSLQHLHQEGIDGCVSDQLEEEQMLQTLEANGAQGGQAE